MELQVNLPETVPPRAEEFLKEVVANLQDSLLRACERQKSDLDRALGLACRQQDETRHMLKVYLSHVTSALAARWPVLETDVQNLSGQKSELTRKIQALELDLAGIDARQKAIQEQIVVVKAEASQRLAKDPVTKNLEKLESDMRIQSCPRQAGGGGRASLLGGPR